MRGKKDEFITERAKERILDHDEACLVPEIVVPRGEHPPERYIMEG